MDKYLILVGDDFVLTANTKEKIMPKYNELVKEWESGLKRQRMKPEVWKLEYSPDLK